MEEADWDRTFVVSTAEVDTNRLVTLMFLRHYPVVVKLSRCLKGVRRHRRSL